MLTLRFDNPEFPQAPDLAHGKCTSAGFRLVKGSLISQDHKGQKNANIKQILKDLLEDNVLESEYDDGVYYTKKRYHTSFFQYSRLPCIWKFKKWEYIMEKWR